MINLPKDKKVILFDGICNLCNDTITKIIKRDKKHSFVFASLQSKIGKEIIAHLKIDVFNIDSIILYEPGISYDIKSTAVLKILGSLGSFWMLSNLLLLLPESLRNYMYDYIAKNRYKWFGKRETCMTPTPQLKDKFLD